MATFRDPDSMVSRSRSKRKDGDSRLSVAQEEPFEWRKLTEEEKEALCQEVLFEDVKVGLFPFLAIIVEDPDILMNATQMAGNRQNEVLQMEEEAAFDGPSEPPLNAADLLCDSAAEKDTFGYYRLPQEERIPFDEDNLLEDVKNPDILLEANSPEIRHNQVEIEDDFDNDGVQSRASLNAADLDSDKEEPTGSLVGRLLFVCPEKSCLSSYKNFKELKEHMKVHSENQEFVCNACKKNFSSKNAAVTHIRQREKKICCGCGKKFSEASSLVQHLRRHTGEKPFICKICTHGFSQRRLLQSHIVKHIGEKPFHCGLCKKSFAKKSSLKRHEETHSREKRFKCSYCDYGSDQRMNLQSHERIHTGEKPFSCGDCGKRFARQSGLKVHEFAHTGEQPFECKDCGKRFRTKTHFKNHIRQHVLQNPWLTVPL